ncbi:MAG: type II toxin-antitoxin system VapC family toxin [Acidobacteria bacterium]|nr:type II toxin-antitoxin system VapC family toxin [Acidobacteriota bacterium]
MIVLDTNVISEPLKSKPSQRVIDWMDNQNAETLFITSFTRAELRHGVLRLPDGKRKNSLTAQVEQILHLFQLRTLDFDSAAADELAGIAAACEKVGKRALAPDAYIAACATVRGFAVATRNRNHFEHLGVQIINPWEEN